MQFVNRYFALIWASVSFLAVLFWLLLMQRFNVSDWLEYSAMVSALYLFYNSRSMRDKSNRPMVMASTLMLVGLGLRVIRFAGAFEVQVLATGMLLVAYLLFFIRLKKKIWIDWLKVIAAEASGIVLIWLLFRLPLFISEIRLLLILLLPVYIAVAIEEARGKDLSEICAEEDNEMPEDVI